MKIRDAMKMYLNLRYIAVVTAVILVLVSGVIIYRKTIRKFNSVSGTAEQLTGEISAIVQDGYLIHGERLIDFIALMNKANIQIVVITKAHDETGKEGNNYNYCLEEKSRIPTYDNMVSKLEPEYINPGAMFMTTVTKDSRNEIVQITFEQR